jgi:hypothetical protein
LYFYWFLEIIPVSAYLKCPASGTPEKLQILRFLGVLERESDILDSFLESGNAVPIVKQKRKTNFPKQAKKQ